MRLILAYVSLSYSYVNCFFSCVERFLYQSLCTCFFFMFLGL